MSKKQIIKMICLNLAIVVLNVILFSQGLVGLTLGEDAIMTAVGVTVIVMSLIAFGYGNYTLLFREPEIQQQDNGTELSESKEYIVALEKEREKKVFEPEIVAATDQIYRFQNKERELGSIFSQDFFSQEIAYTEFQGIISSVRELFYSNIKKMLNEITFFDYEDYLRVDDKLKNAPVVDGITVFSSSADAQMTIYNEQIKSVRELVKMNDNILLKFSNLLHQTSRFDNINETAFEQMTAIREINELISQTNFYEN